MRNFAYHANVNKALGAAVLTAALACAIPVGSAFATPAEDKQAEADAALESLNSKQADLDRASDKLVDARKDRKTAQKKVKKAQSRIEECNEQIEELQSQLGTRARSMYRSGTTTILDVFFSSSSFEEFATGWALVDQMNEKDAEMVQKTKDLKAEVKEQKKELVKQEKICEEKEAEAKEAKKSAEATVAEMTEIYNSLSAEAKQLMEEEEAAKEAAEAAAAQEAIEKAQEEESDDNDGDNDSDDSGSSDSDDSSSSNDSKAQTVSGNTVVDRAYSMLGKKYKYGSGGPNTFDCSGLVGYCVTGSYDHALGSTGTMMGFTRVKNPQPGDICVNDHHCGIYIGGGQMIHAPQTGEVVKISGVHSDMIYVRY